MIYLTLSSALSLMGTANVPFKGEFIPLTLEEVNDLLLDKNREWMSDLEEDDLMELGINVAPKVKYNEDYDIDVQIFAFDEGQEVRFWHVHFLRIDE